MQYIDDTTAVADKPALPTDSVGTPGWFTGGSPGGQAATRVRFWWLNMIQEELGNVLAAASIIRDKTNNSQLLAALKALFVQKSSWTRVSTTNAGGGSTGYRISPDGWIHQWGYVSNAGGPQQVTITYPIAFPNAVDTAVACSANNTNSSNGASVFSVGTASMGVSLNGQYSFYWEAWGH